MQKETERNRTTELWGWVEKEKRSDRTIRLISRIAWAVCLVAVVLYGVAVSLRVVGMFEQLNFQDAPRTAYFIVAFDTLLPLIWVLGVFSLLVAVLTTIATFLRFRTASLAEIQARLAAMESILMKDSAS